MNRDNDLFWRLVEPEYPRVAGFCRRLTGETDSAGDLLQDTLVHALEKFSGLREIDRFRPWLYRILLRRFHSQCRRAAVRRTEPITPDIESGLAKDPSPDYQTRRRLETAFGALSDSERALVILFEIEGWTIVELADSLGIRSGAIRVRLHRARNKMRRRLLERFGSSTGNESTKPVDEGTLCVAPKPERG